jgi:hypothetical protein
MCLTARVPPAPQDRLPAPDEPNRTHSGCIRHRLSRSMGVFAQSAGLCHEIPSPMARGTTLWPTQPCGHTDSAGDLSYLLAVSFSVVITDHVIVQLRQI